jgi:hypothetical protein
MRGNVKIIEKLEGKCSISVIGLCGMARALAGRALARSIHSPGRTPLTGERMRLRTRDCGYSCSERHSTFTRTQSQRLFSRCAHHIHRAAPRPQSYEFVAL